MALVDICVVGLHLKSLPIPLVELYWKIPQNEGDFNILFTRASRIIDVISDAYAGIEMGTTLVLAYLDQGKLTIAHCGDSRCYVVGKEGIVKYLISDHSAGGCVDAPLTRCFLASRPDVVKADIKTLNILIGDRILLCSDGMYQSMALEILINRMLDDKPLASILDTYKFMCEKFSQDNYSAILIKVD